MCNAWEDDTLLHFAEAYPKDTTKAKKTLSVGGSFRKSHNQEVGLLRS